MTASNVFDHLNENYETFLFKGSLNSVRRILRGMEFVWSKGDSFAHIRESDAIRFKRTCFVREYVRNMQSDHPKPVVFLDETWIFMNGEVLHYLYSLLMNIITNVHITNLRCVSFIVHYYFRITHLLVE